MPACASKAPTLFLSFKPNKNKKVAGIANNIGLTHLTCHKPTGDASPLKKTYPHERIDSSRAYPRPYLNRSSTYMHASPYTGCLGLLMQATKGKLKNEIEKIQ